MEIPNKTKSQPAIATFVSWRTLHLFNLYRISVAVVLFSVMFLPVRFFVYPIDKPQCFLQLDILYLVIASVFFALGFWKKPRFSVQTMIAIVTDIIVLTLYIICARSSIIFFIVLINAVIVGGSILTAGNRSIFFAATASLAMLASHFFESWQGYGDILNTPHIGIIGITFFATGLLGYVLSKRIQVTEALAEKRGIALLELAKINNYVMNRLHSGVLVINQQQEVIVMNESAERLLNASKNQLPISMNALSVSLTRYLEQGIKNELGIKNEQGIKKSEPGRYSVFGCDEYPEITVEMVPLETERLIGHVIFLEDASRVSEEAQQIKLAALGRLTASIAHEIRNPLAALTQAAQLLEETSHTDLTEKRLNQIIINQSKNINEIINSILELSRPRDVHLEQINLRSWLSDILEPLSLVLSVPLESTIQVIPFDLCIWADPLPLQRVILNLAENGARYSYQKTNQAKITIRAYQAKEQKETHLDIIDQGPGVSIEYHDRIFEPFFTTESTGTGLGLYIAKELCEANRAKLYYIPQGSQGACFRIVIPNERLF